VVVSKLATVLAVRAATRARDFSFMVVSWGE
jgi:hypothetical protein